MATLPGRTALLIPVIFLAVLTMVIGLMPDPFVEFATRSSVQLLDSTAYITAVLGEDAIAAPVPDLDNLPTTEILEVEQ